jgi:uncharacterized protein YndB with AHSA1/START domain
VSSLSSRTAAISLPSDTEILIVRDIAAPKGLVFDAWSKPEHVRRWYGCRDFVMSICEVDFQEGGKWRWALRNPADGFEHVASGVYGTIVRPERIVFTERFEAIPDSEHLVTLTFAEQHARTTLTMRMEYRSKSHRDAHLKSGMDEGMQLMLARLDEVASSMEASS